MNSKTKVVIMRGISGAGKSTYVAKNYPGVPVVSADHFFGLGADYKFDAAKLGAAHEQCYRNFKRAIFDGAPYEGAPCVVVDNTNTTLWEFKRYIKFATDQGCDIEVVRLVIDPAVAAARNVHGVPAETVEKMQARFKDYPGETVVQAGL